MGLFKVLIRCLTGGFVVRVCHIIEPVFDDPNLVAFGGLPAVMGLGEQAGLHELVAQHVTVPGVGRLERRDQGGGPGCGDGRRRRLDLGSGRAPPWRHGSGVRRAPGGDHLGYPSARLPVRARTAVGCGRLPAPGQPREGVADPAGVDQVCFVDVDDTIRETHGYAKQGVGYGYSGVKGLNAQLAIISTPIAAPVIAATRLRKGNVASAHGAARLISDTLATLRGVTTPALVVVRADSAYFTHDVVAAIVRGRARFSITARMNKAVTRAIATIDDTAWTPIRYPHAIFDEDQHTWISDAEVAETGLTAFTSRRQADHVTARLIVRRVKRLNPHPKTQGELLPGYRYHAVFTDTTLGLVEAEAAHRDHAIIEAVIADLKDGPLAHAPSGKFTANSAWLALAAIAFNLTRAAARI